LQKNFLLFQRNFSDKALIPFIGVSQKQNLMGRRMKRVIRKSEDLPERAAGSVEPAASLPSWIIGDRMILWIQRDIPGSATLMGSFLWRSRQLFGSGPLASASHFFLDMED
jgi:hypothetical protein